MINFQWPPLSVSVPAGGATEAKQDAQIVIETAIQTAVDAINTKTPALSGGAVPVTGPLTDTQLRASAVLVSTGLSQPLTDAQLRATAVPISGTVTANTGLLQPLTDTELRASPVAVSGPLTNTELRAAAVPVSGPLTDTELRATPVPISGTVTANTGLTQPLTDAQLRAAAVPVSGPLTDAELRASAVPVSGPLTDAQLRATAVPISGTVTANTGLTQPLTDAQLRATAVPVAQAALAVTYQEDLTVGTSAETFTAPAGAKSCLIQCPSTNTESIRVRLQGTATTTSGYLFEPGRSEYFPFAANISYIAVAGSGQAINVHFGT